MLSLINRPTDVTKSWLNISQNIFVLVMPRAFLACPESGSQYSQSSPRFIFIFQGCPSSSVTALRSDTSFLLRQARCPPLHLAKAVSFSLRPRESCDLSFTFLKSFTSKDLQINWLNLWKSTHSKDDVPEQSSISFYASQRRMSVLRCLIL